MATLTEFEPFAGIIAKSLQDRRVAGDLDRHAEYNAPAYIVRMCEELTATIQQRGSQHVTLADVVRLEATCTGADYSHKFAMRCHRLALSAPA